MIPHPWESEPNEETFTHTGFECVLRRHPRYGHWNGYVGIPEGHRLWHPSTDLFAGIDVHDDVTYSAPSLPDGSRIDKWWIGFSCGGSFDLRPYTYDPTLDKHATYRTIDYARTELRRLADQLKGLER